MSSGICKNDKEENVENKRKSNIFNFWIYFGIIVLGLLLLIILIIIIYSFLSRNKNEVNTYSTSSPVNYNQQVLTSYQNMPSKNTTISSSLPDISDTITTDKKPFLESLMTKTSETTGNTINNVVHPLYQRKIPINTGGFRCMYKRRF
jgi:uncharacterized protein YpmS